MRKPPLIREYAPERLPANTCYAPRIGNSLTGFDVIESYYRGACEADDHEAATLHLEKMNEVCAEEHASRPQWLKDVTLGCTLCMCLVSGAFCVILNPHAFAAEAAKAASTPTKKSAPWSYSDREPRQGRPMIIDTTNTKLVITFDACRQNEKGHVSCQMTDPEGISHWVYLPGFKFPLIGSK